MTDRALQVGLNITLDSHHINHSNSELIINSKYKDIGIEIRYISKILKEMATVFARLKNQYKFKYQTVFSARFDGQDEDNQVLEESEIFINLIIHI